jgi:hypothetical protein
MGWRPRWAAKTSSRPAGQAGELGHRELEVEGLALAAEAAAHGRLDDADAVDGELEDPAQLAVEVVRHLGAGVDGEDPVGAEVADGAVRLDGGVGGPGVEPGVLHHLVGRGQPARDVAEGERDVLGDVPLAGQGVHLGLGVGQGVLHGEDRRQHLVVDPDEPERRLGGPLVVGRHRRHPVAHVEHRVDGQRVLVAGPGDDAVGDRQVAPGDDGVHAGEGGGAAGVDGEDAGVGVGRAQDLAVQQPGRLQVVGEDGLAGDLAPAVHLAVALADDREGGAPAALRAGGPAGTLPAHGSPPPVAGPGAGRAWWTTSAALTTASRILV